MSSSPTSDQPMTAQKKAASTETATESTGDPATGGRREAWPPRNGNVRKVKVGPAPTQTTGKRALPVPTNTNGPLSAAEATTQEGQKPSGKAPEDTEDAEPPVSTVQETLMTDISRNLNDLRMGMRPAPAPAGTSVLTALSFAAGGQPPSANGTASAAGEPSAARQAPSAARQATSAARQATSAAGTPSAARQAPSAARQAPSAARQATSVTASASTAGAPSAMAAFADRTASADGRTGPHQTYEVMPGPIAREWDEHEFELELPPVEEDDEKEMHLQSYLSTHLSGKWEPQQHPTVIAVSEPDDTLSDDDDYSHMVHLDQQFEELLPCTVNGTGNRLIDIQFLYGDTSFSVKVQSRGGLETTPEITATPQHMA